MRTPARMRPIPPALCAPTASRLLTSQPRCGADTAGDSAPCCLSTQRPYGRGRGSQRASSWCMWWIQMCPQACNGCVCPQCVHVGDMFPLWPLTPKGNYYFLEGANDALLCGNSSDAG